VIVPVELFEALTAELGPGNVGIGAGPNVVVDAAGLIAKVFESKLPA
jgi:hypothetical protein